jgi:hypothetical protein
MALLCAYLGDGRPAVFGDAWAYRCDASWFEASAFVCGFAAGWDAFVAVFTRSAWLAFDLESLAAELAHLCKDHDQSLMLSVGLMVSVRRRVAGSIAV